MPFPESFLFGATIGAHQVEGADFDSDWWRWEQRPSRIRDGTTSERGAGHLARYKEDFALAKKLGHNAVCISLSWPRIHPAEGCFNEEAVAHYAHVFSKAVEYGLTPFCVLHHTTLPIWVSNGGGWHAPETPCHFEHYVQRIAPALKEWCRWWLPLYEPEFFLTLVYRERCWPGKGRGKYSAAGSHLSDAYGRAATVLHDLCPDSHTGLSIRGISTHPFDRNSPWDTRAAQQEQHRLNFRFLEHVEKCKSLNSNLVEFVGLSYFGAVTIRFAPLYLRGACALPVNAEGMAASIDDAVEDASGFEELLSAFASLNKPLFLTGLGVNTNDDAVRCRFLQQYVDLVLHSMEENNERPNIGGLFYSSLLDGFEWRHGYSRRQGLVHVKHPHLERTPNPSAWFFKDIAEHRHIRTGAVRNYCMQPETRQE